MVRGRVWWRQFRGAGGDVPGLNLELGRAVKLGIFLLVRLISRFLALLGEGFL